MKTTKHFSLCAIAAVSLAGVAHAADVLFVDSETPDTSWQTLIESGGHTYTLFDGGTYNFSLNNQESKDYVNGFDVIVVSGSNPVFNSVRSSGQTWHAQPTPILQLGPYLASGQFTNNSWMWFTAQGDASGNPSNAPDVTDASDLIWTGVTLQSGDTVAPDLYNGNGPRTARNNGAGGSLKAGVTAIANASGAPADHVIMYAEPGSIAPGGAASYFMTGMGGGSGEAVTFNSDGEQVFLNTIGVLSGELVPAPTTFPLTITPAVSGFDLSWPSQAGMLYNVRSNAGLGTPINTWSLVEGDIAATPDTNTYNVNPGDPTIFYAVEEYPAPPMEIFSESFDGTTPGSLPTDWTAGKNPADNSSLTNWELGTPANVGPVPPGVPLPSGSNCVATNIGGNYDDPVADLGVAHTDIWLRSPSIDLGAATEGTLVFQQWTQIEDVAGDLDYGSIRILDADDDSELAVMESQSIDGSTTGWEEYSMELPAAAFTAATGMIKVEFQFEADDIDSLAGWYIDDVTVTVPGP